MQLHDLTGLQADYVQTFDMTPEHDLSVLMEITVCRSWMKRDGLEGYWSTKTSFVAV